MNEHELRSLLQNLLDRISLEQHELARQRVVLTRALTELRMGRQPSVVAALIEEACPEFRGGVR